MTIKEIEELLERLPSELYIESFKAESKQLKNIFTITLVEHNIYGDNK